MYIGFECPLPELRKGDFMEITVYLSDNLLQEQLFILSKKH